MGMSPLRVGLLVSLFSSVMPAQPALTISPTVIYECNAAGLGQATLFWQQPGLEQVQIRLNTPDGPVMTGLGPGVGFAQTGQWVSDGLRFFLVNGADQVRGQVQAKVACGQNPAKPTVQLGSSSYFPLAVGNRWIYEINSRQVTRGYLTWTVTRKVETAFRKYFEVKIEGGPQVQTRLFRQDDSGQVYEYVGSATDASEKPLLNPSLQAKQPYENDLARFPDTVQPVTNTNLERINEIYARGVGLVESRTELMTGSSGGFAQSLKLVEMSIPGGIHLRLLPSTPRGISATIDSPFVDLSGHNATNCAVPAYAVMSPGADPPGTYKPCMQLRVSGFDPAQVNVNVIFAPIVFGDSPQSEADSFDQAGIRLPSTVSIKVTESGEWVRYLRVPLFTAPNTPLEPGRYRILVSAAHPGSVIATPLASIDFVAR